MALTQRPPSQRVRSPKRPGQHSVEEVQTSRSGVHPPAPLIVAPAAVAGAGGATAPPPGHPAVCDSQREREG